MTNSIALPTTITATDKNVDMFLPTVNLVKTVAHYQLKIEKSFQQLLLIEKSNQGTRIGKKAEKFFGRQKKLVEIADELKNRMINQISIGTITEAEEAQFIQEVELLNWMHFEVAKSYTAFINENFEARIISLVRPIAA